MTSAQRVGPPPGAGSLEGLRRATGALACLACGKCSTLCPLSAFGPFSARRIAALREGGEAVSQAGGWGDADLVERCLTCGLCEQRCPQQVRFADFVRGVRGARPAGRCPHGDVLRAAARSMAAAPETAPPRPLDWLEEDLRVAEEGEVGLFVGCLPLFEVLFERQMGVRPTAVARAAVRVLNRLGIEPVVAPEERCCGHDLLWNGEREAFEALARANGAAFAARGVRHLLTACAECCRTWRLDYPEVAGYRPRVEHLAEFLAARLDDGGLPLAEGKPAAVAYQDPCRLGRHLGVYEAPRRVMSAIPGTRLREMAASGRDAVCCGTSGFLHCDAASRDLQLARLAGAATAGADTLLTACPKCWIHFACTRAGERRRGAEPPPVEVEDFTVFVSKRLEEAIPGGTG